MSAEKGGSGSGPMAANGGCGSGPMEAAKGGGSVPMKAEKGACGSGPMAAEKGGCAHAAYGSDFPATATMTAVGTIELPLSSAAPPNSAATSSNTASGSLGESLSTTIGSDTDQTSRNRHSMDMKQFTDPCHPAARGSHQPASATATSVGDPSFTTFGSLANTAPSSIAPSRSFPEEPSSTLCSHIDHTARVTDDTLIDILTLVSSPVALLAAVFVCKRWRQLVSNLAFLERCQINPCPLIGLCHIPGDVPPYQTGSIPLNFAKLSMPSYVDEQLVAKIDIELIGMSKFGRRKLYDCYNGGILTSDAKTLVIYYPFNKSHVIIPCPDKFYYNYISHALIDHSEDRKGFKIISLMQNGHTGKRLRPVIFDSVTSQWTFLPWADDSVDVPLLDNMYAQPMKSHGMVFWKVNSQELLVFSEASSVLQKIALPMEMSRRSFCVGKKSNGQTCLVHLSTMVGASRPSIKCWILQKGDPEWEWGLVKETGLHKVIPQRSIMPKYVCSVSPRLLLLYSYRGKSRGKYYVLDFKSMKLESTIEMDEQCFPLQFPWPPELGVQKQLNINYVTSEVSAICPSRVDVSLTDATVAKRIVCMLENGIKSWAPKFPFKRIVIDFGSPNIANQMHIGDVRSTILGDCLVHMFEFAGVQVIRRNHAHQWPMQLGTLVEYQSEIFVDSEHVNKKTTDLKHYYEMAQHKFKNDRSFRANAKRVTSELHEEEVGHHSAWREMCELTGNAFDLIYKFLHLEFKEMDMSFDDLKSEKVLKRLSDRGFVKEMSGHQVISVEGYEDTPVESNGGCRLLASLAALWYRLNVDKADLILYLSDFISADFYERISSTAKIIGWLPDKKELNFPRMAHVGFVHVLGEALLGEVFPLGKLLTESKNESRQKLSCYLKETGKLGNWTEDEIEDVSVVMGYDILRYHELKSNGLIAYTSRRFDHMLNEKGNSLLYIHIAHDYISTIVQNSKINLEELKEVDTLTTGHPDELVLGLHLLAFEETVNKSCMNYMPGVLCDYVYQLCKMFLALFPPSCMQVHGLHDKPSWLVLCHATVVVIGECFKMLGITPLNKL